MLVLMAVFLLCYGLWCLWVQLARIGSAIDEEERKRNLGDYP
jgi:hypothetical protein